MVNHGISKDPPSQSVALEDYTSRRQTIPTTEELDAPPTYEAFQQKDGPSSVPTPATAWSSRPPSASSNTTADESSPLGGRAACGGCRTNAPAASAAGPSGEEGYQFAKPMTAAKPGVWDDVKEAKMAAKMEELEGKPGCCFGQHGGCCFSTYGACCFSEHMGCCFSDYEGCCFSERSGCCFGNYGGCCFSSHGGCCFSDGLYGFELGLRRIKFGFSSLAMKKAAPKI